MKILGVALIIVSSSAIGIIKSINLSKRVYELELIIILIEKIKTYLRYNQLHTSEMIYELSQCSSFDRLDFINYCSKKLKKDSNFPLIWEESILNSKLSISTKDRNILIGLKDIIGARDIDGQLSGIDLTLGIIQENLNDAKQVKSVKGRMYRNLGILLGLGLSILIL